ncbi:MAG: DUF2752 domain-containing protein [Planctomycetes bacterium]|nr:DUF2752 domain-containing protein [Planctomycetota bacterium]
MKIEVIQVCRRPPWPLWAVLIVLGWMGLGAAALVLMAHFDRIVVLCLIKRCTGIPCPTCGFTRGLLSLLHGNITQAWLFNPLLFSVLILFFTNASVRIILARSLRVYLTNTERKIAWILSFVLLFANWAYVIFYIG